MKAGIDRPFNLHRGPDFLCFTACFLFKQKAVKRKRRSIKEKASVIHHLETQQKILRERQRDHPHDDSFRNFWASSRQQTSYCKSSFRNLQQSCLFFKAIPAKPHSIPLFCASLQKASHRSRNSPNLKIRKPI